MSLWGLESALVPVSGAASGIGLAICRRLREAGGRPLLLDVDQDKLNEAVAELYPESAGDVGRWGYRVDVRDSASVDACFDAIRKTHGLVTHAVANAGIAGGKNTLEMDDAFWHRVMDVNLHGVMYFCRAAARHLVEQGSGAIVNTASIAGLQVKDDRAAYTTSKAAVIHFTRSLALDLGAKGIRVNAVAPGIIDTPMQKLNSSAKVQATAARSALQRLGKPEEIADVVMFLLSGKSSYVTGQTVAVDGGLTITYR